jgi:hypothetical protein
MIARLVADHARTDLTVTPNARVVGRISGRRRQIDALIDARHDTDNTRRIIIDAKAGRRKVTVTDVESFRGMMDDVGATHGYLVCPSGRTKSAEKRAQLAVSICLVPLDYIPNFDPATWPECRRLDCRYGRVFWDGYPEIVITLASPTSRERKELRYIHLVGKCDRCGRFHVLCSTCGDILSVPEDDEEDIGHQCSCKLPWFWIASVEMDEHGERSAELHSVRIGDVVTVDRRPC